MICSEAQSVDQLTNFASHFNVVEKLTAISGPTTSPGSLPPAPIKVWLSAVWMREEDDQPRDDFEFELLVTMPAREAQIIQSGNFSFGDAAFSRFQAEITLAPPGPDLQPGLIVFQSRVRKAGAPSWKSQEFVIPLEIVRVEHQP
jgi:hypothetical protein